MRVETRDDIRDGAFVLLSDQPPLYFCAETKSERSKWLLAINQSIQAGFHKGKEQRGPNPLPTNSRSMNNLNAPRENQFSTSHSAATGLVTSQKQSDNDGKESRMMKEINRRMTEMAKELSSKPSHETYLNGQNHHYHPAHHHSHHHICSYNPFLENPLVPACTVAHMQQRYPNLPTHPLHSSKVPTCCNKTNPIHLAHSCGIHAVLCTFFIEEAVTDGVGVSQAPSTTTMLTSTFLTDTNSGWQEVQNS